MGLPPPKSQGIGQERVSFYPFKSCLKRQRIPCWVDWLSQYQDKIFYLTEEMESSIGEMKGFQIWSRSSSLLSTDTALKLPWWWDTLLGSQVHETNSNKLYETKLISSYYRTLLVVNFEKYRTWLKLSRPHYLTIQGGGVQVLGTYGHRTKDIQYFV